MIRIDLTENGDFTPKIERTNNDIFNINNNIIFISEDRMPSISDNEANTNFLTGSIDSINDRSYLLSLLRSYNAGEQMCDMCGIELSVHTESPLCPDCDKVLDDDILTKRLMDLLSR